MTFDFAVAVYQRYECIADLFQDTLIDLDKDFNVIPASAESWSVDASGKYWTFKLRKGLQWSDGTPLTAADYEATFRYSADPSSMGLYLVLFVHWSWRNQELEQGDCTGEMPNPLPLVFEQLTT